MSRRPRQPEDHSKQGVHQECCHCPCHDRSHDQSQGQSHQHTPGHSHHQGQVYEHEQGHSHSHSHSHDQDHERNQSPGYPLCHPHSNHLPKPVPAPPPPPASRVEDLDPPYSAFQRINLQLAAYPEVALYGYGIRHVRPYAQFVFERWTSLSFNDYYAFFIEDLVNPKADDIVTETREHYDLFIPEEHISDGEFKSYGLVRRAGSGNESTSPVQIILILTTRPGGIDTDPGSPWHTGLELIVEGFPAGSAINPGDIINGLWCLITRYEHIRFNDVIELSWDGIFVFHTVSPDEAAGSGPIRVFVPKYVIDAGGQAGQLTIRFRARNVVFNYSGEKYQYSQAYVLDAELDNSLLPAPRFLLNGDLLDSKLIDFDIHFGADFQILINTTPIFPTPTPRHRITVKILATLLDGSQKEYVLDTVIDNNFGSTFVPLDNSIVKEIVGGSFRVSFTWHTFGGLELGRSGSLTIVVVGTPSDMPAVDVAPIELGLIPSGTDITVKIPPYTPYNSSWLETLVIQYIPPAGGGGITFTQEQLAGPPEGTRHVTAEQLQPFVGLGPITIYYLVDDGVNQVLGASTMTIRKSDELGAQIGDRIADMPPPTLQGVIRNNVNPAHVPGDQVLVTFTYLLTLPGDTLYYSINGSGPGGSASGKIDINSGTAGKLLPYPVSRSILDNNNNGSLRISYSLLRPGTPPQVLRSEVLHVTVGVGVFLDRPVIVGASTLPDKLNPLAVLEGATVIAGINPTLATDRIYFDWLPEDGLGSITEDAPGNAVTHKTSVLIEPRAIARSLRQGGSIVYVRFWFNRGTFPYASETVPLQLLEITGWPTPKIDGVNGTILNLPTLDPNAHTRVAIWHFMFEGQRMWMEYEGTKADGTSWNEHTYTGNEVIPADLIHGVRPPTPVDKLNLLKDGSDLFIRFWVSLLESPDKNTAILFGETHYRVQAQPSVLPHPFIGGAPGNSADETVNPLAIEHNTTVTVKYAGMSDKDDITLSWLFANGTSVEKTLKGVVGGEVVYNLTSDKVLHRSVNSTVQLKYSVVREGVPDPIPSAVQTVVVSPIPAASLAGPLINGKPNGSSVDLNDFTGNAKASLAKWPLSNIGQWVWITVSSAGVASLEVLGAGGVAISATEAANGLVDKPVLRSWLEALTNNKLITVTAEVNFTGTPDRANAVEFSLTNYTIISLITTPVTLIVRDSKGEVAHNGTTYDASVTLSGKAAANQQVQIRENNANLITRPVSANGDWSYVRSLAQIGSYAYQIVGLYGNQPTATRTIKRGAALYINPGAVSLNQRIWLWRDDSSYAPHSGPGVFTRSATGGKLPLTYSSNNQACAIVDQNGRVSVRGNGSAYISVRDANNVTVGYTVSVSGVKYFMDYGGHGGYHESGSQASSRGGRLPSMGELREIYAVYGGLSYRGQKHQAFWSTDSAGFLARHGKNLYTGAEISGSELGNGLTLVVF